MPKTLTIETHRPEETQQVGRIIGEQARPGDVYLLTGPLGAGKTCLTQGIALGLGVPGHVRSPTFVLMTRYQGRLTLHHMDLYRIGGPLEAWDLGLDEYLLGDGVCVIEWADQAAEVFPEDALWINLDYPTIQPAGPVGKLSTGSELADGAETAGTVADGGMPLADGGTPLADGGQPVTDGSDLVADGESLTVRGEPVEPGEQEDHRVISLGRHSPRYDSLWRKLAEAFPQIEASP
ncbi:MAG: tRNA (adenosine(37)-N6)-threonylcarbamoyltransferase complex ATPase subunit type 1 TsaE [Chloroflexi bacterium]|nr:tRNA (adenosine(37)-N6)-threonylcarbamoyltransferase complex ATPase subunit type 1 TsaE [Chloroflexota bacterium]